ncbi:MAG: mechanosensitive ion channel [Candidatus Marinimicrobia bacterium]|nr:mechanosensitive ion channel [FCB group bacterium]MBL7026720.1 mechanosensitive ion channel [Candidatus Neomarinimicrobiota bacterium]
MNNFDTQTITDLMNQIYAWFLDHILIWTNLVQLLIIVLVLGVSLLISKRLQPVLQKRLSTYDGSKIAISKFLETILNQIAGIQQVLFLWVAVLIYRQLEIPHLFLNLVLTLLLVWVIIQIISVTILDKFWAGFVSMTAWGLAALSILGILTPMIEFLDKIGFHLGEVHITVLATLKAIIFLVIALRLSKWFGGYFDKQISRFDQLSASSHVLISKTIRFSIYFLIALIVLDSIGVDLTALAVFGGALGVGIGFGLQKVSSNLLSGIILLSDRSIKPGDVVQIGEVYGWISSLKSRYVSVVTRDGHEYLIPNEDLITQQVINWSYSDKRIRLKVPFGVAYKSNPHEVRALVIEAMNDVPRVLKTPPPMCLMTGFGDSSIDLELRFWIDDPKNGTTNIQSDALFRIWDTLKENGIEIPFPQRDVHLHKIASEEN